MLILIEKDSSTRVPREVKDIEEARGIAREFPVFEVSDDPTQPLTPISAEAPEGEAEGEAEAAPAKAKKKA